ncbi:MAG: Ig domain-containing protein [Candidatus Acidiferrales bacterium]
MKNRLAAILCALALGCFSIGCGVTSQTNNAQPTNPSNPSNPTNPSDPSTDPAAMLQITTTQLPDGSANSPYAAQLSASGGTAPYVWSISGALPSGLTMSSTGAIAGSPTTAGNSMVAVDVKDSEQQPQTAQISLALDVATTVQPSAATTGMPTQFYGAGRGGDSLANCTVGPNGFVIAYRFVAEHSGPLNRVRFYIIPDHPGYAGGDAGSLKVSIETDDGTSAHNPSGTVLATGELASPLAVTGSARYFPLITFASPPNLTAGNIYHVVFTNTDSNPSVNFLSVDDLYYKSATTPNQPTVSDLASAVLRWRNGWQRVPGFSPIFELYFSNGDYQGYGYVEAFVTAPENISGSREARETFTVSGSTRSVSSVGIRLARVSGTGNLTVRLENSAGTLIEQGYLPASSFPLASPASHVWATYKFASVTNLVAGQTYHLVLEAPSSSEYEAFPIEKGTAYGFDKLTYFPDGYAQFNPGTGWVGWSVWGVNNRTDGDLQFYFGLAQ